ncbi:MAG: c-type cytochrome [Verrucomicrobia bacterium]|nr:c-type cytochrome [Verrucomicrobiota bacterium]
MAETFSPGARTAISPRTVNAEHADKAVRAPFAWRRWRFVLPVATLLASHGFALAAGRQLTGVYAPTPTPALAAAEAQKRFVLHEGFEARIFAAEPDVVNPVAMTWDERGRLWVLELHEYPMGAKPGEKPRDRIKILEDTNNDGHADKVTVFADGLNLATGLLLGNGGVYVGQAPHLLFLQDTNHDDRVDTREILLTGFGLEDRHELLNGFTWGPDGWLYMTHGVFTHSKVKIPEATEPGVIMNAAVARFHPRTKKFEVFAEGTSNPWGVDFDRYGNAFISACVIDHLFHIAPGGSYQRQAGAPSNPYTYELLPSIVDHKHHMAAYCGICVYQGDQFPEEYRGRVFMGNIHQNAINHDRLIPNGSSFKAVAEKDFLTTSDGWFRPVSQQVGPDGALWIADWYDKYPCYQNAMADPEGVNREHGRIWRVVYVGKEAGKKVPPRPDVKMDLAKLRMADLARLLEHANQWQRRMAQRVLTDRIHDRSLDRSGEVNTEDPKAELPFPGIDALISKDKPIEARFAALSTWFDTGRFPHNVKFLEGLLSDTEPVVRKWAVIMTTDYIQKQILAARNLRQKRELSTREQDYFQRTVALLEQTAVDADASVRLAVATAVRQIVSSSLTVNTDVNTDAPVGDILAALIRSSADAKDLLLPYMIWHASEPLLAHNPKPGLNWLAENGPVTLPLSGILTRKAMRRICDTQEIPKLDLAVNFLERISGGNVELTLAAIDGLLEGQKARPLLSSANTESLFAKLNEQSDARVKDGARQLGTLWGHAASVQATLRAINDSALSNEKRLQAITAARQVRSDAAREALLQLSSEKNPEPLVIESIRALGAVGGESVGDEFIKHWRNYSPGAQAVAAEVLVSRRPWTIALLSAIEAKTVAAADLPAAAIRALGQSNDQAIRQRATEVIGRIRPPGADKQKVIEAKKRMILRGGEPDLRAGHELTKQHCLVCHKLNGEGAEVGPDLTGSGRSTLDALLANVIDPNQIIGKGFENVEVETKDGRSISGRLVEDTAAHVKLLASGPKEEVIARSDIEHIRVSELSVMPEGLEQLPDADFRNMMLYILNPPPEK